MPNRYELYVSNEVLQFILINRLQEYQRSKLGVEKKLPTQQKWGPYLAEPADFIRPPTLTSDILQPLDQNECLVPHLKESIYICSEPKVQGHGTTLRGTFRGSK